MTKFMLSAATAALLTATGASAQVIDSFNQTVDDALAGASASFASIALNNMAIDGSIDISADAGQAFDGAFSYEESSDNSSSSNTTDTENNTNNGSLNIASALAATAGGIATDTFGNEADATGGGTANFEGTYDEFSEVSSSTDDSFENFNNDLQNLNVSGNFATAAATQSIGDVASLAAGAVNDGTFDVTEMGSVMDSSSSSSTSQTMAEAMANTSFGSGVGIVSAAINDADNEGNPGSLASINGTITIAMGAGNIDVGSVDSVAAGAINTTGVTAVFFGSDNANP